MWVNSSCFIVGRIQMMQYATITAHLMSPVASIFSSVLTPVDTPFLCIWHRRVIPDETSSCRSIYFRSPEPNPQPRDQWRRCRRPFAARAAPWLSSSRPGPVSKP